MIADSIELVARGHLFDGTGLPGRLRQDDPGRGDGRSAGSTCPAVDPLQRHDLSRACYKGRRDADGRDRLRGHRRLPGRQDHARRALRGRERRPAPAPGACGGQFTANTMSHGARVPRPLARPASTASRPSIRPRMRRRAAAASWSWTSCGPIVRPSSIVDRRAARERHRRRRRQRRLDQRRPPPAGHRRASSACRSQLDDFAHDRRPHADRRPTWCPADATRPPTCTKRAAWACWSRELAQRGPDPRRLADGRRPDDRPGRPRTPSQTPGSRSCARSRSPSSRRAA